MEKTMDNQTKKLKPIIEKIEKVWTPNARLLIPNENKMISFAYPLFGPDTYRNVGKQILENNLQIPTAEQTIPLLYAAYFSELKDNPEFGNIRDMLKNRWLWIANRNLWTDKGVYVVPDPEAKGLIEELDINKLEKMLKGGKKVKGVRFSENGKVRFAPRETYKLEKNTSDELAENGFVIASYGVDRAKQLAEISTKFPNKPYIYGLDISRGDTPKLRVSALDGDIGKGLDVYGYGLGDLKDGHAFGVLK